MFVRELVPQRRLGAALTAGLLLVLAVSVTASAAARDRKAPRIVAAALEDADRDGRADRLRLTYSERVTHARDGDGAYPFRVAGHRIRGVGAAAGRVLFVSLAEPPVGTRAPASVRYSTTRSKPVRDRAGNQAAIQTVTRIRVRVVAPKPEPKPNPTPADRDGDGVLDADDGAPADPAIKPGAPDCPTSRSSTRTATASTGPEGRDLRRLPGGGSPAPGTKAGPMRELRTASSRPHCRARTSTSPAGSSIASRPQAVSTSTAAMSPVRGSATSTHAPGSPAHRKRCSRPATPSCCSC